ncbi:MAG: Hsp20/alpha crystallin family protein [Acidobacteriia bacterium]|jgi:HSP20 family protein|nr:Hsp20/alpha crystallin family protein [Terriglobia bacterium]
MAIQRWDPLRDLVVLQERMNRMFEDALARSGGTADTESLATSGWRPSVDIFEQDSHYVLRADLPGIPPDGVEIEVEGDALTLRGERRPDAAVGRESYLRAERPQGRFSIQITLPPSVERSAIRASQRDGVLDVVLPKKEERAPGKLKVDVR